MRKRLVSPKRLISALLVSAPLLVAACDSVEDRTERHYEAGLALIEEGSPDQAVLEFRNALQLNDQHAQSHFELGKILEARGELRPAFGRYRKAVEFAPELARARVALARIYLVGQEFDKADEEIDAALALDPNDPAGLAVRAQVSLQTGDAAAAREAIDRALLIAPEDLAVLMSDIAYQLRAVTTAAALARTDEALAILPNALELHVVRLGILSEIGDQALIGDHLTAMVARYPDDLRFRDARWKWAAENNESAILKEDLKALALAQPENLFWATNLIRAIRAQDGDAAALAAFDELIAATEDPFRLELLLTTYQVEMGRRDEAAAFLRALFEREGQSEANANTARIALARLMLSEGRLDEAYALVDEVAAIDPTNTEALLLQSARLVDGGELEAAIQKIRIGLNEAPDDTRLLLLAAQAQELSGNIDLANDRFAKAVRIVDYDIETVERYVRFLTRAERHTAVEIVLNEALARAPEAARLHDILGFSRVRRGDWAGARQAAQALQRLDPDRSQQLRAAILIGQERFDEGASLLRDLPENEALRASSVGALVQTYIRAGQMEEAVAFLDDLLAREPANLQALGLRGNLHLLAGDLDTAEMFYRRVLEIDPQNGGAYSALARLFAERGDEAAAEEQLLAGIALAPNDVVLLARLAQFRESKGDFGGAIGLYEQIYEIIPGSILIANNLASLLSDHRSGNDAAMDRAFQIAGRLKGSEVPQYSDTYGWIAHLRGDHETALEHIEPASRALAGNPWVHYHLGMVYAALARDAEATEALETALARAGDLSFPPRGEIEAKLAELARN